MRLAGAVRGPPTATSMIDGDKTREPYLFLAVGKLCAFARYVRAGP